MIYWQSTVPKHISGVFTPIVRRADYKSLPMVFCPGCRCCGSGESGSEMCAVHCERDVALLAAKQHPVHSAQCPPDDGRKDTWNMFRNNWLPINHHLLHLIGLTFICLSKMHGHSNIKNYQIAFRNWLATCSDSDSRRWPSVQKGNETAAVLTVCFISLHWRDRIIDKYELRYLHICMVQYFLLQGNYATPMGNIALSFVSSWLLLNVRIWIVLNAVSYLQEWSPEVEKCCPKPCTISSRKPLLKECFKLTCQLHFKLFLKF
jgi:hypothetical protein